MNRFAPIFVAIAAALWGVDGVVLRPSLYNLPVVLVVFIESSIVALMLSPFFLKKIDLIKQLKLKDWLAFFAVGLFGGALGTIAITKALFYVNFVNLSVVILIQKLQPVFALLLAAIVLKERLPVSFFIWAAFAIIGAYFMTFGAELPNFNAGNKTTIAAALSLFAAVSFGSSTVLSKRALKNVSFGLGTYLRFLVASLIMLLIVSTTGKITSITTVSNNQWLIFLLIAFTTGGAAIFLYYYGLKKISASVSTICELTFPMTAILLDYILHGNMLDIVQWTGLLVMIISIVKVSKINFISST
ncbi:DMT family transporter [Melioribacteraceae bacterium 4301-Me]|uniref:DMT family transporter n=1 Tax=Pyranulibacter aquaticus TaxID=3163344 RepID=UPI003596C791